MCSCGAKLLHLSLCWCWYIQDPGVDVIVNHCRYVLRYELFNLLKPLLHVVSSSSVYARVCFSHSGICEKNTHECVCAFIFACYRKLVHLNLTGVDKISGKSFVEIPTRLPDLTFLDLRQCNKVQRHKIPQIRLVLYGLLSCAPRSVSRRNTADVAEHLGRISVFTSKMLFRSRIFLGFVIYGLDTYTKAAPLVWVCKHVIQLRSNLP